MDEHTTCPLNDCIICRVASLGRSLTDQTHKRTLEELWAAYEVKTDLLADRDALKAKYLQQNADECETDTAIRELCRPFVDVDGDKYGVPGIADIVKSLIADRAALRPFQPTEAK